MIHAGQFENEKFARVSPGTARVLGQARPRLVRWLCARLVPAALLLAPMPKACAGTVVEFAPGVEASAAGLTSSQISALQATAFNTLVLFSITIETNGDFYYGGGGGPNILLCTNGTYAGPSNWGSLLSQCEAPPSCINRIEMCIGGWGDQSFLNIKNLIAASGTNASTVLYQNLRALKSALGLNAIDYDDEYEYDSSSAIAFGHMCGTLGMKVTLCPYTYSSYWQAVISALGSTVDYIYLQCYSGGAGNDAASWSSALGVPITQIFPGDWDADTDIAFMDLMQTGEREGCTGGFHWPNASNGTSSAATLLHYGNLIQIAFGPYLHWQGGTADYNAGANWAGGNVPGIGANAINDSGSNNVVQINAGDPTWNVNCLWAGDAPNAKGSFVQNGSTINVGISNGWFRLGDSSGAAGYYTLNGGTLNCSNYCDIGEAGTGVLKIYGGILNISSASTCKIGVTGTYGAVLQTNGTVNSSGPIWVGNNAGTGTYTLSGGTINAHNTVTIGRNGGSGTFIMTGGTINQDTTGTFLIGSGTGGGVSAAVFQWSGGTINCGNAFYIPEMATCTSTCNISGTAVLNVTNALVIGRQAGVGVVNLSGGTINKLGTSANNLIIGGSSSNGTNGYGTLNQTGGSIVNTVSATYIGNSAGGVGVWNLGGGTATLGQLTMSVSVDAVGTLNLNSGLLKTTGINCTTGGTNTLNYNGGTLQATAPNASFITGLMTNRVLSGGAVIDSQSYSLTIPQALTDGGGGGGLIKLGSGSLSLTASNTFIGATVISNGVLSLAETGSLAHSTNFMVWPGSTLNVSAYSPSWTLGTSQVLSGSGGTINGSVQANGTVAPGFATNGILTVTANLTLAGKTLMKVNRDRGAPAYDSLVVNGTLTYGGSLVVVTNGTTPLQVGDAFNLFTNGAPAGGFSSITLPVGYVWATNLSSGTIKVTGIPGRTPPEINNVVRLGGSLILSGTNGSAGGSYSLLSSTNLTLPLTNWTVVWTTNYPAGGHFTNTLNTTTGEPQRFYLLQ